MITIDNNNAFAFDDILFTFALASEAAEVFNGHNKVITGIGKVNAAYQLTKAIAEKKPKLVVNLGSAGSSHFTKGEVVCCTQFIQRDMDVQGLGFQKYETPLSGLPSVLEYGLELPGLNKAICGTGDNFETGHITTDYTVVDMEAYALALVAMNENIPPLPRESFRVVLSIINYKFIFLYPFKNIMSRNYKFHNSKGLYFVSFAVVGWLDVFTRNEYKDILVDSLEFCQNNKAMEIHAWCIMTNHIHLIFRSTENQKPELLLGDFKRFTSRNLIKAIQENPRESRKEFLLDYFKKEAQKTSNTTNHQFWRHDNKPIELWSNDVIQQKIDYIHNNPVEEGIVFRPEDYKYSSAPDYAGEKGLLDNVCVSQNFKL